MNSTPRNKHFPRHYKSRFKASKISTLKSWCSLASSYSKAKEVNNMSPMTSFLLFFSLALLSLARAQGRAPHGLVYENPMAFSPSAVDFFHPNNQQPSTQNPCTASNCSPLPMAAQVEATLAHQSKASSSRVGAGGIAGMVFGFVFAVLLAMGVYYVAVTRRANLTRANSVQPDA